MTTTFPGLPFGAQIVPGGVRFRLWAPDCDTVSLVIEGPGESREIPLERDANGWCETTVEGAGAGTRYRYRIDGDLKVPDTASRFQPDDVHGASEVIDPAAYTWRCTEWAGRPWEEVVLYECHIGTFTPEGTFLAAIEKLDYLVDLGITALELMPVADFPGDRNWGYDGACLFAPDSRYGRPEDLKTLIDAAHERGLMVFLDVVYNHFGPEGNYLYCYAKRFFNPERHTPWGAAINFDGRDSLVVRDFFAENARYWIDEYRFDGLRFDAVHAIEDLSEPHILNEIAVRVRAAVHSGAHAHRHVHLVLENDKNESRYLGRDDHLRPHAYVAQWNDDIHHAYHVLTTGEDRGYYADYADDPGRHLARCLTQGFAYQGDPSPFRDGEIRGEPSAQLPPTAFVNFVQNHDQVGNRAFGERLTLLAPEPAVLCAATTLLLSPSPPLLFMGEEWGADEPFLFFCDLGPDLKDPVREGRRREFASFPEFQDPESRERIPDPTDEETFRRSQLDWSALAKPKHRVLLDHYKRLLALRRTELAPRLHGIAGSSGSVVWRDGKAMRLEWRLGDGSTLSLLANVAADAARWPGETPPGRVLTATAETAPDRLPPWFAAWYLDDVAVARA